MTIATAIEATLDRAASAADRAYQLTQEQIVPVVEPVNWRAEAIRWKASFEHECQSHIEARAKIGAMDETIYRFRAALMECLEWFEDREDIDNNGGPNAEMKMASMVKETLGLRRY